MGQRICKLAMRRLLSEVEKMARASAVGGAEMRDGARWRQLGQLLSPETLQPLLGFNRPDLDWVSMAAQIIYMPSGALIGLTVAGQAGPKPTGPPGAAYVEVVSPWKKETSQRSYDDLSIFFQP